MGTIRINLSAFVVVAAIGALLSGCASPKYEVVKTDRWIVKDGWVVGEKDNKRVKDTNGVTGQSAVKEEKSDGANSDNNGKYCDNAPKQSDNRNIKPDRFNRPTSRDRNDTARNATLAQYKGKPIEAIEEAWVRSVLPNTQIELIRRSPAVGFYTAFLSNGQVIYVNPSQRLLFFGEIYTSGGDNLTNLSKERFSELKSSKAALEINASELEQLGFGEIGDKEERYVAMVTSPLCPYCHRADEYFSINQIPVKRIFLVDLQNPNDEGVKRTVEYLTAPDKEAREALLVKWRAREGYEASKKADGSLDKDTQEAIKSLNAMREFAERNAVEGTPYIYLVDREANKVERLIAGYAESIGEQIKAWYLSNNNQTGEKR